MSELGKLLPGNPDDLFEHLVGELNCLGFNCIIEIIRIGDPTTSAKKPTHEVYRIKNDDRFKFGGAWLQFNKRGEPYLSVVIDDPTLAAEIKLAVFRRHDHAVFSFRRQSALSAW